MADIAHSNQASCEGVIWFNFWLEVSSVLVSILKVIWSTSWKQKQQQFISQASLKQDIEVSSKETSKTVITLASWSSTLLHRSLLQQHVLALQWEYLLQLTASWICFSTYLATLIEFMVAESVCCFEVLQVCLFSSTPKWSALTLKGFQSDLRHKLTAEASV